MFHFVSLGPWCIQAPASRSVVGRSTSSQRKTWPPIGSLRFDPFLYCSNLSRCVSPRFDAFLTCSATGLTCFDTFRRVSTHSLQTSLTRSIPAWFLLGGEGEQLVSEEVSIEVMDFWALRLYVNSQSLPSFWLLRNTSLFLCSLPRRFP